MTGTAILVLGMHRSGTSAVAGALRLAGVELGRELMPAGPDNPTGFWEHAGVVAVHERLLHALGREWHDPRPLPAGWEGSPAARAAGDELEAVLRAEFDGVPVWAVKDPRACRLLPVWETVLRRLGVQGRALFVARAPAEVAASLAARNAWPPGLARLLWMRYLAEAESASRTMPRDVLPYPELLRDPVGALRAVLSRLDVAFAPDARMQEAIAGFVAPSARHHRAGSGDPQDLAQRMYAALAAGEGSPWARLQPLLDRFAEAAALYDDALDESYSIGARPLIEAAESTRRLEALVDERTQWARSLEAQVDERTQWAHSLEAQVDERTQWAQSLEAQVDERTRWARSLEAELDARTEWARSLEADLDERTRWAQALDAERGELQVSLQAERESAELARSALQRFGIAAAPATGEALATAIATLGDERDSLSMRLNQILASRSWALTRPLRALGMLARGDTGALLDGLRRRGTGRGVVPASLRRWVAAKWSPAAPAPVRAVAPPPAPSGEALALPTSDAPRVSIVIPAYGNAAYTVACLCSIVRHPPPVPFEVVVIEDASGDPGATVLRDVAGLRYHENSVNLGFLRSCNQAATLARGEYLCLLNNDTEVTAGWMDALLAVFEARADAGLVGARLVYPDGRLQEAGGIVWDDASAWNYGRLQDPSRGEFGYLKPVDYASAAAVVMRTALFRELGGFDERYAPAYCEDSDLAFRVREAGLQVYYQPRAHVVHHEGISHGTDTAQGLKAYQVENQAKFLERWRHELARAHLHNGEWPFLARDRSQLRKTLLVIDHYVPQPDRDAGSRTMWQLLRAFVAQGLSVKFLPANRWYDADYAPRLEAMGVEILHGPSFGGEGVRGWLRENGAALDYVLLSRPHVSDEFVGDVRAHTDALLLFYGHDVHHLRMAAQAAVDPGSVPATDIDAQRVLEERAWRRADRIYYPADGETAYVNAWLARAGLAETCATLPAYAFETFAEAPWENLAQRRDLLFVAGFAHPPNADAAGWFVREVMPLLRARHPGLRLLLVGSNPSDDVRRLACGDVVVTGFVTDAALEAYYGSARVVVAPLRYGGGMKGKVVEAMRFGVPCVTSATGAQGLDAASGFLVQAESPEAFAAQVSRLLGDDAQWRAASEQSLAFVRSHFSGDALWRTFGRDVDASTYPDVAARRRRLDAAREAIARRAREARA